MTSYTLYTQRGCTYFWRPCYLSFWRLYRKLGSYDFATLHHRIWLTKCFQNEKSQWESQQQYQWTSFLMVGTKWTYEVYGKAAATETMIEIFNVVETYFLSSSNKVANKIEGKSILWKLLKNSQLIFLKLFDKSEARHLCCYQKRSYAETIERSFNMLYHLCSNLDELKYKIPRLFKAEQSKILIT